jgi:hypothetical protein
VKERLTKGFRVGEKKLKKFPKGNGAFLLVEHDGESTKLLVEQS